MNDHSFLGQGQAVQDPGRILECPGQGAGPPVEDRLRARNPKFPGLAETRVPYFRVCMYREGLVLVLGTKLRSWAVNRCAVAGTWFCVVLVTWLGLGGRLGAGLLGLPGQDLICPWGEGFVNDDLLVALTWRGWDLALSIRFPQRRGVASM